MQIVFVSTVIVPSTYHMFYAIPSRSTTPHQLDIDGGWLVVAVALFDTQDTQSALPTQLPLPGPAEENEDNGETNEEGDIVQVSMFSDDSESSELSDSD